MPYATRSATAKKGVASSTTSTASTASTASVSSAKTAAPEKVIKSTAKSKKKGSTSSTASSRGKRGRKPKVAPILIEIDDDDEEEEVQAAPAAPVNLQPLRRHYGQLGEIMLNLMTPDPGLAAMYKDVENMMTEGLTRLGEIKSNFSRQEAVSHTPMAKKLVNLKNEKTQRTRARAAKAKGKVVSPTSSCSTLHDVSMHAREDRHPKKRRVSVLVTPKAPIATRSKAKHSSKPKKIRPKADALTPKSPHGDKKSKKKKPQQKVSRVGKRKLEEPEQEQDNGRALEVPIDFNFEQHEKPLPPSSKKRIMALAEEKFDFTKQAEATTTKNLPPPVPAQLNPVVVLNRSKIDSVVKKQEEDRNKQTQDKEKVVADLPRVSNNAAASLQTSTTSSTSNNATFIVPETPKKDLNEGTPRAESRIPRNVSAATVGSPSPAVKSKVAIVARTSSHRDKIVKAPVDASTLEKSSRTRSNSQWNKISLKEVRDVYPHPASTVAKQVEVDAVKKRQDSSSKIKKLQRTESLRKKSSTSSPSFQSPISRIVQQSNATYVVPSSPKLETKKTSASAKSAVPAAFHGNSTYVVPSSPKVEPKKPSPQAQAVVSASVLPSASSSATKASSVVKANLPPVVAPKIQSDKERVLKTVDEKSASESSSSSHSTGSQASQVKASAYSTLTLKKKQQENAEILRKKQEEGSRNRELFLLQKKEAQRKKNEEWKAKIEKVKAKDAQHKAELEKKAEAVDQNRGGIVHTAVQAFIKFMPGQGARPPKVAATATAAAIPKHLKHSAMAAASSCPNIHAQAAVGKKHLAVSSSVTNLEKCNQIAQKVFGSAAQLPSVKDGGPAPKPIPVASTSTALPTKKSTLTKPAPKPVFLVPSVPVKTPTPKKKAQPVTVELDSTFESSFCSEDTFATAGDLSVVEGNENINTYDITVFEDLDDNMEHRANKRIPDWAGDSLQLHQSLFMQQPALLGMIRKPVFPNKNPGYKLFPTVPY